MQTRSCAVQRRLYGLLAASAMMLIAAPMTAAYAGDAPGIAIRYDAHDLASDAAAQQLLHRIEAAAHQLCSDQDLEPLPMQVAARRCYLTAVRRAVGTVNAPRVKAAYLAKYVAAAVRTKAREAAVLGRQPMRRG